MFASRKRRENTVDGAIIRVDTDVVGFQDLVEPVAEARQIDARSTKIELFQKNALCRRILPQEAGWLSKVDWLHFSQKGCLHNHACPAQRMSRCVKKEDFPAKLFY